MIAKSGHGAILQDDPPDDPYHVEYLPIGDIKPSPENDHIYGALAYDEQMKSLIDSIERNGLEEPLIVTADDYVLSGHRRLWAVKYLRWNIVPCRIKSICRTGNQNYHRLLSDYNPQRVKQAGSLLKEALLRDTSGEDSYEVMEENRLASLTVDAEFMTVAGAKNIEPISDKKQVFLKAVKKAIQALRDYWPLSIRQIHYRLLNNPPLTMTPKRSKFGKEEYRYKNDEASYSALVRILASARYLGEVSMSCIDDPTRPQKKDYFGYDSLSDFLREEIDGFLTGFAASRQQDQPRHIEIFGEKSTLKVMIERACTGYHIPYSLGRGYCSIPVWRDIAKRFKESRKQRMTLIIVSDFDPDGLELADDAIRSLSQLWEIPIDGHRIAITREQVNELGLADDFNPAKVTSSRFTKFVERTGGQRTWEVEALEPSYLVEQIKAAIEANMDMKIYERVLSREETDREELADIRKQIAGELSFF
ncbi:MAG: ParB N-terminal domain-containing protein [Planctomycetota bacterium]|nr:ParB N-terminal domain-containing protein [Planctomycetota bacterium]